MGALRLIVNEVNKSGRECKTSISTEVYMCRAGLELIFSCRRNVQLVTVGDFAQVLLHIWLLLMW
jgi:hypothetical protein